MSNKKSLPVGDREGKKGTSELGSSDAADITRRRSKHKRRTEREEEIARERKPRRNRARAPKIGRLRLSELATLIKRRYGGIPDTDDADIFIHLAAQHLEHVKDREFSLTEWCRRLGHRPDAAVIQGAIRSAELQPRRYNADQLAAVLALKIAERDATGLHTIGATDFTKAQREARRKKRDRERKEMQRREEGRISRAAYRAKALSNTRPWEALGISRRTYYRRHKSGAVITK